MTDVDSTQPSSEPSERIGRYRIVSEIGRGAMGIVYKGEDEGLGRSVAIKTILASMDTTEQAGYLARFKQEAKALGGLNHPSIITVFEFGDERGVAYLAMEYLEGREVRDLIAQRSLDLASAVDIAAQVADGLAFAHGRGVVHRDIKPGNVMVMEGNRAKIMDFGIARVRTSDLKTQTGLMLGSPRYMSPEQVFGRPVDHRSDIFSLGLVLYEMIAGTPPFGGNDIHQIMYQICNGTAAPPSAANPAVTRALDIIVARALEKDVAARYQDAAAMAADLRACLPELAGAGPAPAAPQSGGAPGEATIAAATIVMPIAGLHVLGRFEPEAALKRLAEPRGEDRRRMAPTTEPLPLPQRWLSDGALMAASAVIAAALAAAAYIATISS
jgi:eukaryotic-like serine/threonine-protein kinase